MADGKSVDQKRIEDLETAIDKFATYWEKRHGSNFVLNGLLVFLSLLFVSATVIAGVLDYPKSAAIFGVINGFIIAIQSAFATGSLAEFQRVLAGSARRLQMDLKLNVKTEEQFNEVYAAFRRLWDRADTGRPKGKEVEGMARTLVSNVGRGGS